MSINSMKSTTTIKFLCSYGGKILPRHSDGKLRYHGGDTRVLAVDRSVSFAELLVKLGEMCGTISVSLRCQLPKEDLDALISITSDEDLANLFEEYDRADTPRYYHGYPAEESNALAIHKNSFWELSPCGGSATEIRPVGIIGRGY